MSFLKKPEEIENYEEKAAFLKANGWRDLWHSDNWVKLEWYNLSNVDIDRMGIETDHAYIIAKEENATK